MSALELISRIVPRIYRHLYLFHNPFIRFLSSIVKIKLSHLIISPSSYKYKKKSQLSILNYHNSLINSNRVLLVTSMAPLSSLAIGDLCHPTVLNTNVNFTRTLNRPTVHRMPKRLLSFRSRFNVTRGSVFVKEKKKKKRKREKKRKKKNVKLSVNAARAHDLIYRYKVALCRALQTRSMGSKDFGTR